MVNILLEKVCSMTTIILLKLVIIKNIMKTCLVQCHMYV